MTNKNEAPEDGYLIRKSGVFYRPDSCGYTRAKAEAGRYSLKDAIDITHPNGPDGPRDNMRYIHESEVLDPRADLSDAKDKRIAELEALVHKLASDPDYTAAYAAGVADQKATLAELEAKLALADVLATECERAFDDVDETGTQEFYLALYTYTDSRATLAKLTTNPNVQERTKP